MKFYNSTPDGSVIARRDPYVFTGETSITITHNWGVCPLVVFVSTAANGAEFLSVVHAADKNSFTYESAEPMIGELYIL